jgi:hypothetical protein
MVSQGSAISTARLEFACVLFIAIAPILISGSSEMTRAATLTERATLSTRRVADAYGKLPLSFEVNKGQTDPRVKFLSRGRGYSLFLTGNEAVLSLRKRGLVSKTKAAFGTLPAKPDLRLANAPVTDSVVSMNLIGANPNARVRGLEELPGKSNYFIGKDPKKWRTNVPTYAKVKYTNPDKEFCRNNWF